jgi:hypothetical protein
MPTSRPTTCCKVEHATAQLSELTLASPIDGIVQASAITNVCLRLGHFDISGLQALLNGLLCESGLKRERHGDSSRPVSRPSTFYRR